MSCLAPFHVKNKVPTSQSGLYTAVPCGKCPQCLKRRASQWIFRLKQEDKISTSAMFVTLTYDDSTINITHNGFMTLNRRDVQLYMKLLRKKHKNVKLKYYLAGEYGSKLKRPHYHMILFNADEKHVRETWKYGAVDVGHVSGASIGYVTGYIHKGRVVPEHKRDDRIPEFSLMSKGLGVNYINDASTKWHHDDPTRFYVVESGNNKVSIPRYYRDRLYTDEHAKLYKKHVLPLITEAEEQKISDFVRRTGSLKGYSRAREESIKATFENSYKREKQKRMF